MTDTQSREADTVIPARPLQYLDSQVSATTPSRTRRRIRAPDRRAPPISEGTGLAKPVVAYHADGYIRAVVPSIPVWSSTACAPFWGSAPVW
jgi:hypothetical protein